MSLTSGFYNSINGDRKYNAKHISKMFEGFVTNGVYISVGEAFFVNASNGNTVKVGPGRAWFNNTWLENSDYMFMDCGESDDATDRIDAIVIEIDTSDSVRDGFIKYVKGTTSKPTLIHNSEVNQYAICYITRKTGSTAITQTDISNVIGSKETPFVSGFAKTINATDKISKWNEKISVWFTKLQNLFNGDIVENLNNRIDELQSSTESSVKEIINKKVPFEMKLIDGAPYWREYGATLWNPFMGGSPIEIQDPGLYSNIETYTHSELKNYTYNELSNLYKNKR